MKVLLCLLSLLCLQPVFGQVEVVEKTFPFKGQELDIDVELGTEISVKAWTKPEISVKVSYEVNGGENNDAIRVDLDDYTNRLSIDVDLNDRKLKNSDYCCCENKRGSYYNGDSRSQTCLDLVVEVMIPTSADLRIESVISDVIIEGMSGNMEVETVTGTIDLAWEEGTGAEVTMKTTTGDVYTNLDLDRKKKNGLSLISSHNVQGTYKDGKREVLLKTVTSDIYFRKPEN